MNPLPNLDHLLSIRLNLNENGGIVIMTNLEAQEQLEKAYRVKAAFQMYHEIPYFHDWEDCPNAKLIENEKPITD